MKWQENGKKINTHIIIFNDIKLNYFVIRLNEVNRNSRINLNIVKTKAVQTL